MYTWFTITKYWLDMNDFGKNPATMVNPSILTRYEWFQKKIQQQLLIQACYITIWILLVRRIKMKHDLTLSSLSCKITASLSICPWERQTCPPPPPPPTCPWEWQTCPILAPPPPSTCPWEWQTCPPPPPLVLENGRLAPHQLFSHMPIKSFQCKPCKFVGHLGLAVSIHWYADVSSVPHFSSPFSSKVVIPWHCLVTLPLTLSGTVNWLSSFPLLMQKSFWCWLCGITKK